MVNALLSQLFWNVLQVWMTGKDVYYKWHEVDQTKHEIFCVHIVCNEIQVKVNLEITTFFFYLRFPYCPNLFWFGVVKSRYHIPLTSNSPFQKLHVFSPYGRSMEINFRFCLVKLQGVGSGLGRRDILLYFIFYFFLLIFFSLRFT